MSTNIQFIENIYKHIQALSLDYRVTLQTLSYVLREMTASEQIEMRHVKEWADGKVKQLNSEADIKRSEASHLNECADYIEDLFRLK